MPVTCDAAEVPTASAPVGVKTGAGPVTFAKKGMSIFASMLLEGKHPTLVLGLATSWEVGMVSALRTSPLALPQ